MGDCQPDVRIESERLWLRRPAMADAARIVDLLDDPEIARMTANIPYPYQLRDAVDFLERLSGGGFARDRPLLIDHREFGPIGMTGFQYAGDPYPEIGYWLGRTFRGRGFATEAVCAALDWARRAWGKRALVSGHFVDNPASGRVLEKAGFLYTGEIRRRHSLGRGGVVDTRMMVWLA